MSKRLVILVIAVTLTGAWLATAQQTQPQAGSNAVWQNARPGGLAQRNPGRLVDSGLARFNAFQASAFTPPEITETSRPTKLFTQIQVQAIQLLFDNLNAVLLALDNAIRAQAGFAPYIPNPIRPAGGAGGLDLGSLDVGALLGGG
ncbi:MAG: hypothetical protein ACYSUI_06775 [Planctomycetota bacterium]|jgi:hypothetical protein